MQAALEAPVAQEQLAPPALKVPQERRVISGTLKTCHPLSHHE